MITIRLVLILIVAAVTQKLNLSHLLAGSSPAASTPKRSKGHRAGKNHKKKPSASTGPNACTSMDVSPAKETNIPADGADVGRAAPDGSAAAAEAAVTASGPAVRVAATGAEALHPPSDKSLVKRRRSSSPAGLPRCSSGPSSGLHLSRTGAAYKASLEAKCNDTMKDSSGQRWRTIESRVMVRNERAYSGKSTSSGEISADARRERLENTKEIRALYQNITSANHCELLNNPFRSKCVCTKTPAEEGSAVPGGSVIAAIDSEGSEKGNSTQLPGESTGPMQATSVGEGVAVESESPVTDATSFLAASPSVLGTCDKSSRTIAGCVPLDPKAILSGLLGSASNSATVKPGGGAPIDFVSSNSGESIPEPVMRAASESHGEGDVAKVLGAQFVDNMSIKVAKQFARVAEDAGRASASEINTLHKVMDEEYPRKLSSRERKRSGKGRVKSERRPKDMKVRSGAEKRPETGSTSLALSEENKEHLKILTTAVISDMMLDMQRLVAADPRIKRFSFETSKRFKERIIKDYRADLVAKRKSEIALLEAALTLAKSSVSSAAYASVRQILVRNGTGFALPTVRDLQDARSRIEGCLKDDLRIFETEDGWAASPRATIEMELLRLMQMATAKATRSDSGGRLLGHSGPGMLGWQDLFNVKITLDARTITKKTSHTEVMMQIYKKGKGGEAESQKSLCMRTLAIFMGKDSRENVQANLTGFFQECEDVAKHGVVFNKEKDTFLGQSEAFRGMTEADKVADANADPANKRFYEVKIQFWVPADMAAQCALIGHGCGGHNYCAHCNTHAEERHLPYAMKLVDEDTSLQALAKEHDMHARTLYAINAAKDHKGVQRLTEEGLRNSTVMDPVSRERAREQARETEFEEAGGARRPRPGKRAKVVPVAKDEPSPLMLDGNLTGWLNHGLECRCNICLIPKGTTVRVIPIYGFCRDSEFLHKNFPSLSAERMPFCALHCLMRVTEGMFYQICQAVLTSKDRPKLVSRMNEALMAEKINRKFQQNLESEKWEKVSFEGHQAKALLKTGTDGKMAIERILEAIWPGATEDGDVRAKYGNQFVPRTLEVWRQWAVVEELMSERFSDVLLEKMVDGLNGYERFGMECREFIFRFQAMSTEDYSKSYYLHTLLHHAGDFMRELKKEGMTLGMMSNSGAERRHEYGRRASRKGLASNGWRKKIPEYDTMKNLAVYITLKEIWMWDYGGDLLSHEVARLSSEGESAGTGAPQTKGRVEFKTKSRRALLTEEEACNEDTAGPFDPPPCFETKNEAVWGVRSNKEKAHAIHWVFPEEESDEEDVKACKSGSAEKRKFNPDHRPEFFSHVPVDFSDDESHAGSEEDFEFSDFTINDVEFEDADDPANDKDFQVQSRSELDVKEEWIPIRLGGGGGSLSSSSNDKDFQAARNGENDEVASEAVQGRAYGFRANTLELSRLSREAAEREAAATVAGGPGASGCTGLDTEAGLETSGAAPRIGLISGSLVPAAVSQARAEDSESAGGIESPSTTAAAGSTRVGTGSQQASEGAKGFDVRADPVPRVDSGTAGARRNPARGRGRGARRGRGRG